MDVSNATNGAGLNGGGPHLTGRAATRAARAAERAPPPAATTRTAAQKKRKKRGTGAKAMASAARRAAETGAIEQPKSAKIMPVPIVAGPIGGHPLAIELAATLRTAGKGWTPERAKAFVAAVNFALPTICSFPTTAALPKAA